MKYWLSTRAYTGSYWTVWTPGHCPLPTAKTLSLKSWDYIATKIDTVVRQCCMYHAIFLMFNKLPEKNFIVHWPSTTNMAKDCSYNIPRWSLGNYVDRFALMNMISPVLLMPLSMLKMGRTLRQTVTIFFEVAPQDFFLTALLMAIVSVSLAWNYWSSNEFNKKKSMTYNLSLWTLKCRLDSNTTTTVTYLQDAWKWIWNAESKARLPAMYMQDSWVQ